MAGINEDVVLMIIRALGALGTTGLHWVLGAIEKAAIDSPNKVDDELFVKVINAVKSFEPKNPTK